ncbi:MAG: hypothetical protein R3B57_00940 [Phycisphaerales bacterium]
MVRSIVGVILGYVAIFIAVAVLFSLLMIVLGTEGSYKPGSWEASTTFAAIAVVLNLIAAALGGFVCRLIARKRGAVIAIAIVIAVLGIADSAYRLTLEDPGPREGEVSIMEGASRSRSPVWFTIAQPIVGVLGALIGGGALKGGRSDAADRERVARDAGDEARGNDSPDDADPTS